MQNSKTKDQYWLEANETAIIKHLNSGKPLDDFLRMANIKKVTERYELKCCDGRLAHKGIAWHIAGSGILLSEKERDALLDTLKSRGLKTITSHDDCAAAQMVFAAMNSNGNTDANIFAMKWAQKAAERAGLQHRHISMSEYKTQERIERLIWFDNAGIDPNLIEGMPNLFYSNSLMIENAECVSIELAALIELAMSDIRFGRFFTDEQPLYVIATVKSNEDAAKWKPVLEDVVNERASAVKLVITEF